MRSDERKNHHTITIFAVQGSEIAGNIYAVVASVFSV
jgi:sRNA-binding regulator protein Hfq